MKVYLDCYPCFFIQTIKTARRLTSDENTVQEILMEVCARLPHMERDVPPPAISLDIYRIITEKTGVEDPYLEIKNQCTRQALKLYPRLKERVKTSPDSLLAAIKVAVAGNIIDFGTDKGFKWEEDLEDILSQDFTVNDYPDFARALKRVQSILYLGDNAGETVFDRILIEEMARPVTYVVRERPIINDAVWEDAAAAGLDEVADILSSGCPAAGTIPDLCSRDFLDRLSTSELIVSKGQGNYEGLSEASLPVFFLLKAKCQVIARDLGVEEGSIIFMKSPLYKSLQPLS